MRNGDFARSILLTLRGHTVEDDAAVYIGRMIWSRAGTVKGVVTDTSLCRLEGCGGTRLHVKWSDGRRSYPCARGCDARKNGDLQIM